jgi:KAP family P-loop domain
VHVIRHIPQKLSKVLPKMIMKKFPYYYKYQYLKENQLQSVKILTDDVEFDTTNPSKEFNFNQYSQAVVSMINGSYEKFSVGIYAEWGTGKTTLMKLVEKNLMPYVFTWRNVPGKESVILKKFLRKNFDGLDWIDEFFVG